MSIVAGVDGCPGGWICLRKDTVTSSISFDLYPTARALFSQRPQPDILLIDIPIGLSEVYGRKCDTEARKLLGRRHVCVFSAPIRSALRAKTRPQASQITAAKDGRKVGCQAYAIYDKIRQVDAVLSRSPQLQDWVFEVHPEVSFRAWNGGEPLAHGKKGHQGKTSRGRLIGNDLNVLIAAIRKQHPVSKVADDDIADAFAAIWTAERKLNGEALRIPNKPPIDSNGLRMEIWY